MKFQCNSYDMISRLKSLAGVLPSRSVNTILDNFLVEAADGAVKLTASDSRLTLTTTFEADVSEEGRGAVPGKLFTEVISRMDGAVTVTMSDKCIFTVRSSGSKTTIAGQDASLYPELPARPDAHEIHIAQDVFQRMIDMTAFSVGVDDMREVLNGVYLCVENGKATMVGLDGFRLATCETLISDYECCKAIIPLKGINSIARLLTGGDDIVALAVDNNGLSASVGGYDLYVQLIQGDYIKWQGIIPKTFTTTVTVNAQLMRGAVERAMVMARQGNNNLLHFCVTGDEMAVEARSQIGDVHEALDVLHEGDDITIAFNAKYVFDVLKAVGDGEITIRLTGGVNPCVIQPAKNSGVTFLILPVRTQA